MIITVFVTLAASRVYKSLAPGRPGRLNSVRWCLIFVGLQYGTCFMSPFWRLESGGSSWIIFLENLCTPALLRLVWYYFSGPRYTQSFGTVLLAFSRPNHAYRLSSGRYIECHLSPFVVTITGQTAVNRILINTRWSFIKYADLAHNGNSSPWDYSVSSAEVNKISVATNLQTAGWKQLEHDGC